MARQQQYLDALYDSINSRISADDGFIVELVDALDDYVVYDSSDHRMQQLIEQFNEYEYLGIRQLEGQTKLGEEFMEFYPDEASVRETVIQLCYTPKNGDE
jgi:hypothetical protein